MTDEARLARLTELARRAWPEHRDVHVTRAGNYLRAVTLEPNMRVLVSVNHARPYDALEAALLVLNGERLSVNEWARQLAEDSVRAGEAEYGKPHALPAWVEQLAEEWERDADACEAAHPEWGGACLYVAKNLREVARELRARARGDKCE